MAAASADLVKNGDFSGAQELIARYTDVVSTTFLAEQGQQIAAARGTFETRLAKISDSITEAIRARRLGANVRNSAEQGLKELEQAGAPADTLSIARDRIAQAYVQAAHEAQQRQDWSGARQYIAGGNALKPSAPVAAALQDAAKEIDNAERLARAQLDAEARRQLLAQQQKEEADLRAQLAAGLKQENISLDDARRLAGIADRLVSRGVRDPAVTNAKTELQNALARQVAALSKANDFDAAVKLAEGAFALFPTSTIAKRSLDDVRAASQQRLLAQREAAAAEIRSRIDSHLKNRKIDDAWDAELKRQLRQLSAYVPANDPYVTRTRTSAARIYLEQARTLRSSQRLTEAGRMLERAREYGPGLAELASEEKLLADARARVEAETRERTRLANIQAAKQRLLVQAKANEVQEAQASLKELQSVLPPNDAFLTTEAPQAIGAAYLRLASTAAKDGRFRNAVELAERGAQVVPNVPALAAASKRYARYMAIDEDLATRNRIEVIRIRRELSELAKEDPSEAQAISQRIARNFVQRISTVSPSLGGTLARAAMEIFPNDPLVSSLREQALDVVRRGGDAMPTPRETREPAREPPRETARPTIAEPASTPAAGSAAPPPQEQPQAAASAQSAGASGTEDACKANLAGYGRRRQGICSDLFEGGRGPELVVIPAGGPIAKPFAIGRTEVSVAEYALYCTRSGRCTPPTGPGQQPITNISIADAERYTQWLTQVTGFTYRLPTGEEWTYAANAGATGAATDSNSVNCVVELGGKKIRGTTLD
ncbi:MAG TPA: SUMF1/EgtB/PvdO family nonheme iron enzyme, partial [Steroidobacteraceae bacterium]